MSITLRDSPLARRLLSSARYQAAISLVTFSRVQKRCCNARKWDTKRVCFSAVTRRVSWHAPRIECAALSKFNRLVVVVAAGLARTRSRKNVWHDAFGTAEGFLRPFLLFIAREKALVAVARRDIKILFTQLWIEERSRDISIVSRKYVCTFCHAQSIAIRLCVNSKQYYLCIIFPRLLQR